MLDPVFKGRDNYDQLIKIVQVPIQVLSYFNHQQLVPYTHARAYAGRCWGPKSWPHTWRNTTLTWTRNSREFWAGSSTCTWNWQNITWAWLALLFIKLKLGLFAHGCVIDGLQRLPCFCPSHEPATFARHPVKPWTDFITADNRRYVSSEALDFIDNLLR